MNKKFRLKPVYIILLLTDYCNLNCRYCYRGEIQNKKKMTWDIAQKTLDIADSSKKISIQLSGGEPALEPDLINKIGNYIDRQSLNAHFFFKQMVL